MRKIYQSAPDVPQSAANRAIDIIERHFAAAGARRADDLSEEDRVHLLRSLQWFFESEVPPKGAGKGQDGSAAETGLLSRVKRWFEALFSSESDYAEL